MGQMAKIPWLFSKLSDIFSKFPDFPDLEKILFFPDISLTRGNSVNLFSARWLSNVTQLQLLNVPSN